MSDIKTLTTAELRKKLTDKEKKLVDIYLSNGYNKQKAGEDAGYSAPSARITAHKVLQKTNIKAYVDAVIMETMESEITVLKGRILAEFDSLGFSDIKDILDDNGNIDLSRINTEDIDTRAIKSIRTDVSTQGSGEKQRITEKISVTYHDKLKALEIMAKYAGMLIDRHEIGYDKDKPLIITIEGV